MSILTAEKQEGTVDMPESLIWESRNSHFQCWEHFLWGVSYLLEFLNTTVSHRNHIKSDTADPVESFAISLCPK